MINDTKKVPFVLLSDGDLYADKPMNYEAGPIKWTLGAFTYDRNGVLDEELVIRINVIDVNDNPPRFNYPGYYATIDENTALGMYAVEKKQKEWGRGLQEKKMVNFF